MKTYTVISILFLALLVTSCGSNKPFSRGDSTFITTNNPPNSKPTPETNNPVTQPETPPGTTPNPPTVADNCIQITNSNRQICESDFTANVLPALKESCDRCHENPAPDFKVALMMIEPGDLNKSLLYVRAIGSRHRKVWDPSSAQAKKMEEWILGK